MRTQKQLALCCPCGQPSRCLCTRCRRRRRLSIEKFGGKREEALARDEERCTVCGAIERLVCHHRRRINETRYLATLCRGEHNTVHHAGKLSFWWPEKLKIYWRELHREHWSCDQIELPFREREAPEQLELVHAA